MSLFSSVCMNVLSLRAWKNCYLTCWEPYWIQLVSCRLIWEALLGFIWKERQSLSSFGYCFERFPGIWKSSSLWWWHFCWLEKFQWPGTLTVSGTLAKTVPVRLVTSATPVWGSWRSRPFFVTSGPIFPIPSPCLPHFLFAKGALPAPTSLRASSLMARETGCRKTKRKFQDWITHPSTTLKNN